ncbi:MAG TPA: cytochrome c biogenesis protein [Candidatus Acidoferrales bacterium]|nr:cytochrome c biogenesis protein [Candidatus Acidoferrales bacterium]
MKRYGIFALILAGLMVFAGYAALFIAPDEATMHAIQRIFYFHASSGWAAMEASMIVFFANIAYLAKRDLKWDWLAISAVEVSVAFWTVMLVTGPIWAHPVWGVWWTWDWRLTLTLVIWILYLCYMIFRTLLSDPERRAVFSAVFGIFVFLGVPLDYLSIRIWRTQHPQPVIFGGQNSGLDPTMAKVFFYCSGVMTLLMILLVIKRYRLERLRHEAEELRLSVEEASESAAAIRNS